MRIGGKLHFSPKYKFSDIDWNNDQILIDAFQDRVENFYIRPAQKLNASKDGFAAGVLCVTTIDFLARIALGVPKITRRDYVKWVRSNIQIFQHLNLASRLYVEFRCGLVHEGRIKNTGQFSYEHPDIVKVDNGAMSINPDLLLKSVEESFGIYLEKLKADGLVLSAFRKALLRDFRNDIAIANRLHWYTP